MFKIQGKKYKPTSEVNLINDEFKVFISWFCLFQKSKGKCVMFWSLFKFKKKMKNKNLTILLLDPKFKSLCLIFSFIGWKEKSGIIDEHHRCVLYHMLLKWYHHLHLMSRSKVGYVEQTIYENFNLKHFSTDC